MTIDDVLERILGNSVLINTGFRLQDPAGPPSETARSSVRQHMDDARLFGLSARTVVRHRD